MTNAALDVTAARRSRRNLWDNTPDGDPQRRERDPGRVSTEAMRPMTISGTYIKGAPVVAAVALVSLPFVLVEGARTSGGGSAPFPSPTSLAFVVPHSSTANWALELPMAETVRRTEVHRNG